MIRLGDPVHRRRLEAMRADLVRVRQLLAAGDLVAADRLVYNALRQSVGLRPIPEGPAPLRSLDEPVRPGDRSGDPVPRTDSPTQAGSSRRPVLRGPGDLPATPLGGDAE